jgi:deoxyuridine 5'-triphosphate nucleotidohydrolase
MNYLDLLERMTEGSAGYDITAPDTYELLPGMWTTIDTGITFDDTVKTSFERWCFLIFPRSGLSTEYRMRIVNTVPVIDQDYRGSIKLMVTTDYQYTLKKGERFAQGIIIPYGIFEGEHPPMRKRNGGFGSTGRV